jgi:hypothetical protein
LISISIKSEIDSRVILYPMMKCLRPLGNVLIVTSNKQVCRLIEGDYEGDFRNFHILFDTDGGTDELLQETGISPEDYTYVVYDNVGVIEQDKLIIPIGPIVSENFESEMMYLGEDRNTHILRFGKSIKKPTPKPPVLTREEKKEEAERLKQEAIARKSMTPEELKAERLLKEQGKSSKSSMTDEEMDEAARRKFQPKKEDITAKLKKLPNLQFPKFDDLEFLESNKQFFEIDRNFIKFFFTVFQDYIGIKEHNFVKEVTRRDASSSDFSQRSAVGENSIKLTSR